MNWINSIVKQTPEEWSREDMYVNLSEDLLCAIEDANINYDKLAYKTNIPRKRLRSIVRYPHHMKVSELHSIAWVLGKKVEISFEDMSDE